MESGTWADWFSAVGTVGAFAVTLFIVLGDRAKAAQAQAGSVSAWFQDEYVWDDDRDETPPRYDLRVQVHNSSQQAISEVQARIFWESNQVQFAHLHTRNGDTGDTQGAAVPGATLLFRSEGFLSDEYTEIRWITVLFTDALGQRWERNLNLNLLTKSNPNPSRFWRWRRKRLFERLNRRREGARNTFARLANPR